MHYTKSIIYYNTKGPWPHKLQEAKYKTMCGQEAVSKTTNRKVKLTTCVECLKIVLVKENDKLAKIAERIRDLENVPPPPKLPTGIPLFLKVLKGEVLCVTTEQLPEKKCCCKDITSGKWSDISYYCPLHGR